MPVFSRLATSSARRESWLCVRSPRDRLGQNGRRLRQGCSLRSQPRKQRQLLAREEAQVEPAEDVVHQALRVANLLVARPARRLEARVRKLLAQHAQRNAVLQRERDRCGECIHQAGNRRTFLRHLDEDLARLAGGIEADRDVALVTRNRELVRDGGALLPAGDGAPRAAARSDPAAVVASSSPSAARHLRHGSSLGNLLQRALEGTAPRRQPTSRVTSSFSLILASSVFRSASARRLARRKLCHHALAGCIQRRGLLLRVHAGVQRLRALRAVAINRNRLDALAPALGVSLGDILHCGFVRQVHGLRNRAGEERLRGRHHLDVAHVMDRSRTLGRLEAAIEDRQVLRLDARRAFDGSGRVDVADDRVDLVVCCSRA